MPVTLCLGIPKPNEEDMMHCGERNHVWEFGVSDTLVPDAKVSPVWGAARHEVNWFFVCVGGHNGKGCGARMSISDAAVALTARQNAWMERNEARAVAGELFAFCRVYASEHQKGDWSGTVAAWLRIRPSVRRMLEQ